MSHTPYTGLNVLRSPIQNGKTCGRIGYTLGAADVITLGLDEGTELGSPYGYFGSSNEVKPDGSLLGEWLG